MVLQPKSFCTYVKKISLVWSHPTEIAPWGRWATFHTVVSSTVALGLMHAVPRTQVLYQKPETLNSAPETQTPEYYGGNSKP